jgi:DNA-binding beta-propeller fold protein YncE
LLEGRKSTNIHGRSWGSNSFGGDRARQKSDLKTGRSWSINREKHMLNGKGHCGLTTLACVGLALVISNTPAAAWDRGSVNTFAVLPQGTPMVEGLTVGPNGNVYVSTFNPTGSGKSQLFTFDSQGMLLKSVKIQGSSSAMLGLAFRPGTDALRVIDFGAGEVLVVDPDTGRSTTCITLKDSPGSPGLNALTFDAAGNTYISDSFQGIIWRLSGAVCGEATAWVTNDLLLPKTGVPGFGANGLGFNKAGDALFVANTAMDWIVKIPVSGGVPGTPEMFTNSINGADGLVLDSNDNIWVAANQADEIVVVDPSGKAIAKLGDFEGLQNGVTQGLLFPASPAFSKDGQWLFVTNLELDLRTIGGPQTVDSQWAAQVVQHSIAKLPARILGF